MQALDFIGRSGGIRTRDSAWRLTQLARLFKREGLVSSAKLFTQNQAFTEPDITDPKGKRQRVISPWELRRQGLDRLLTPLEWARVIYHLCKHRGFHWISKAEEAAADSDAEGGKVKKGLKDTTARMAEKGYRSAAEMVLAEFPTVQRNKQGQYDKALSRVLLGQHETVGRHAAISGKKGQRGPDYAVLNSVLKKRKPTLRQAGRGFRGGLL